MSTGKICNEEKHVLFVNRKEGDLATESIPLQDSPTPMSHRGEEVWEAGLTSHVCPSPCGEDSMVKKRT